jgi:hypothetical protein
LPFAVVKVDGNVLYLENILTQKVELTNGFIISELFIKELQ